MKIHYINAVCGGGKTTAVLKHHSKYGSHTLMVQPTTNLIKETYKRYAREYDDDVFKIHSIPVDEHKHKQATQRPVYEQFNDHSSIISKKDKTLTLLTHAALLKAPVLLNKQSFDLIIDETIGVDNHIPLSIIFNYDHISKFVDAIETDCLKYYELVIKPGKASAIKDRAEKSHLDTIERSIAPLWQSLASEHQSVFVRKAQWDSYKINREERFKFQLDLHTVLKPSVLDGWKSVRIMAANFTESFMYSIWEHMGVEWVEEKKIKPRILTHDASNRLTVHYLSDKRNTRYLQEKVDAEGDFIRAKVQQNIKEIWGDDKFLWFHNNRHKDYFLNEDYNDKSSLKGQRLSNFAHGLNDYDDYTNVVFLSALNNSKAHIDFLTEVYGFDSSEIYAARAYEAAYQCIMRTALRIPDSTKKVNALVVDRGLAEFLNTILPGSKVVPAEYPLTDIDYKKTKQTSKLSVTERARKSRQNKKKLVIEQEEINKKLGMSHRTLNIENATLHPIDFKGLFQAYKDIKPEILHFSLFLNLQRSGYSTQTYANWDQLALDLHKWSTETIAKKDESVLISPAKFLPNKSSETNYGLDNLEYINSIWLDIDDGELTPELVSESLKLHGIKHLSFNSYSHHKGGCKKKPVIDSSKNSFRVLIPLQFPVAAEQAEFLWDQMVDIVTNSDPTEQWWVGAEKDCPYGWFFSGIDRSKRTPVSMFYLPSRAWADKDGHQASFFDFSAWELDIVNPVDYILRASVHEKPEWVEEVLTVVQSDNMKSLVKKLTRNKGAGTMSPEHQAHLKQADKIATIDKAKADWLSCSDGHNKLFFIIGLRMYKHFASDIEFINELSEIGQMYSKAYGRKAAKGVLKGIKKRYHNETSQ